MVQSVGVVGAGQMGAGIAQVAAQAGYQVTLVDLKPEYVAKGLATIDKSLGKLVEKKVVDAASAAATRARIRTSTSNADLAGCDLVVEAIVENAEVKRKLFAELEGMLSTLDTAKAKGEMDDQRYAKARERVLAAIKAKGKATKAK